MKWFWRLPPWVGGLIYSAGFFGWSIVGLYAGVPPWWLLAFAVAALAMTVVACVA